MKINNALRLILTASLFLFLGVIYTSGLNTSFIVNSDFGRDIFEMQKIINGDFTLIGPMLSVGIFTSPLYFYLYAPVMAVFHHSPITIVYANAILFSFTFSLLFYLLSKKQNPIVAFLIMLTLALLPQTIYSARYPGNAFSYYPFLLFILFFPVFGQPTSKKNLIILGILSFICLSFHPISIFGIAPLIIWLVISNRNKLQKLIFYFVPTVLFILPMVFFELRHNFIISRNFTYRVSSNNLLPQNNLNFIEQTIVNNYSPYIFLVILAGIIFFILYFKKFSIYEKILSFWTILYFLILIIIIPKYDWSYLVPLNIMLAIALSVSFTKTRIPSLFLILLILLINIYFPHGLYTKSQRPISRFEDAASYIADNFPNLRKQSFNIIQVSDENILVPVGHEYRFFLNKMGLISLPETNYLSATNLIIFSEIPGIKISAIDNWEINQFGKKFKVEASNKVGSIDIFLLGK
jgi:hypothetical protein